MMSWLRLGLPLVLLALCSQSACGHHSDHLCMRRSFWKELMLGLENINPVFSPECRVEYDVNLEVPAILEPAGHHKAGVAVEMLKGIVRLFSESETPFPKKRRLMFLNRLTEILSHLQSCMESPHSHNIHRLAVQGRFQKLGAFLLEKGNSDCAWEIVHAVTRVILQKAARNHTRK